MTRRWFASFVPPTGITSSRPIPRRSTPNHAGAVEAAGDEFLLVRAVELSFRGAAMAVAQLHVPGRLLLDALGLDAIAHEAAARGAVGLALVRLARARLVHLLVRRELVHLRPVPAALPEMAPPGGLQPISCRRAVPAAR